MSIYSDIKKATQIPLTDEISSFIRQRKSNVPKKNPKLSKPKRPRNMNLYDEDDNNETDDLEQNFNDLPKQLYENEIAFAIKQANCGINYSNENLEKHLKARQIEATLNSSVKDDSKNNDVTGDVENEEYFLKLYKLNRNAAIRGLLRNHKISLHDLRRPNTSKHKEHKSETHVQLNNLTEENYPMKLVPHPEDSEVFVQPIHAYGKLDENKYKNIDFSVPRIGKKNTVTPRKFYVSMDESEFDFVKGTEKRDKWTI
ncbi:uncharacterized protein LOC116433260 isoform X2 [Nomia melanderi]|uniref:uncharacterized protein LOC116433260 isoform X2 n=1 Tax=Nomia melanderi TaxID=2448451 RepID=UPI0013046C36|nr:uncharacterized protein LOC116433260 isoform X2 [Nomia melanderi]